MRPTALLLGALALVAACSGGGSTVQPAGTGAPTTAGAPATTTATTAPRSIASNTSYSAADGTTIIVGTSDTVDSIAQLFLIWVTTVPIAAFHFRHSIAGSVEAFYRAAMGAAPWGEMFGAFVLPALIGNAIGGVLLVALFNYAQVAEEHAGAQ